MVYCGIGGTVNATPDPDVCIVNNAYVSDDLQNVVTDGLGTTGASIVEWIDLVVLLVILGFIVGIFMKLAALFK